MVDIRHWLEKWDGDRMATIEEAWKILGKERVYDCATVFTVRNVTQGFTPQIRYTRKQLRYCARENKSGADWRLVYVIGFGLITSFEQSILIPTGKSFFATETKLWHEQKPEWATASVNSGYRLVNFNLQFPNLTFSEQEERLINAGSVYQRTKECIVAEVLATIHLIDGRWLLDKGVHQGPHARIGYFTKHGLSVFTAPDIPRKDTGVIVSMKTLPRDTAS